MYAWGQIFLSLAALSGAVYFLWPVTPADGAALFLAWASAGWFANAMWRWLNPKILKMQEENRRLSEENARRMEDVAEQIKTLRLR